MVTAHFSPSARDDMTEIFDYIARDKPLAAARWIGVVEEKCELADFERAAVRHE